MQKVAATVGGTCLVAGVYAVFSLSGISYARPAHSHLASAHSSTHAGAISCPTGVDPTASTSLATWQEPAPSSCAAHMVNGYPVPSASCTPGATNPTVTLAVLQSHAFKTGCERDKASSPAQKDHTYGWYGIAKPAHNIGLTQTCEKDHLISLELGGADTVDNIWPQCGPDGVPLASRYFKQKDAVEDYLAAQVRAGAIPLADAQRGIATDWTQYLDAAKEYKLHHPTKRSTSSAD